MTGNGCIMIACSAVHTIVCTGTVSCYDTMSGVVCAEWRGEQTPSKDDKERVL